MANGGEGVWILIGDTLMFKIDFEYETPYGTYRDAIALFDGQTMTPEEVEAEKQRRLDQWLSYFEQPAEEPPAQE